METPELVATHRITFKPFDVEVQKQRYTYKMPFLADIKRTEPELAGLRASFENQKGALYRDPIPFDSREVINATKVAKEHKSFVAL